MIRMPLNYTKKSYYQISVVFFFVLYLRPNTTTMNIDTYHIDTTRISKSGLDLINLSPALYKHVVLDGNRRQPTKDMEMGSHLHELIFEPRKYYQREMRPFHDTIVGMRDSIMSHPIAAKLLAAGVSEVVNLWTDEVTGVECKMRTDWLPTYHNVIVDLKKCADASPRGFRSSCRRFRYDAQSAFYLDGAAATNPKDAFIFIAVEDKFPFRCEVYSAPDEMIIEGRAKYRDDLELLAQCRATGVYPSYKSRLITPIEW